MGSGGECVECERLKLTWLFFLGATDRWRETGATQRNQGWMLPRKSIDSRMQMQRRTNISTRKRCGSILESEMHATLECCGVRKEVEVAASNVFLDCDCVHAPSKMKCCRTSFRHSCRPMLTIVVAQQRQYHVPFS